MWETPSSSRRRAATVVVAGRFPSPGGIASRSSGPRRPLRTPGAISPGRHFPQARAASGTAGRALVAAPPSGDAAPGLQRQTSVLSALQGGGCGRGRAPPTKERQAAIGTRRPSQPGRRITSPRSQRSGSADYRPSASQVSTAPSWALTKGRRSGGPFGFCCGVGWRGLVSTASRRSMPAGSRRSELSRRVAGQEGGVSLGSAVRLGGGVGFRPPLGGRCRLKPAFQAMLPCRRVGFEVIPLSRRVGRCCSAALSRSGCRLKPAFQAMVPYRGGGPCGYRFRYASRRWCFWVLPEGVRGMVSPKTTSRGRL